MLKRPKLSLIFSSPTSQMKCRQLCASSRRYPTTISTTSQTPKSKTGLGLVRHITLEDEWLLNCVANCEFTTPPDDSDACGIMNPADAVARYKERVSAALDRVRAMPGDSLATVIDLMGMIQAPGVNFLAMAAKHSVHHRGQLSTYLRAMGGAVPSIYGPSADTQ